MFIFRGEFLAVFSVFGGVGIFEIFFSVFLSVYVVFFLKM